MRQRTSSFKSWKILVISYIGGSCSVLKTTQMHMDAESKPWKSVLRKSTSSLPPLAQVPSGGRAIKSVIWGQTLNTVLMSLNRASWEHTVLGREVKKLIAQAPLPWNSPEKNTGVGSHSLLQGIFPTQGLNPGLPCCRWILYCLSPRGRRRCCLICFSKVARTLRGMWKAMPRSELTGCAERVWRSDHWAGLSECLSDKAKVGRTGRERDWVCERTSVWGRWGWGGEMWLVEARCTWSWRAVGSGISLPEPTATGLPRYLSSKEPAYQCRRCGLHHWVRKIPWGRKWQPTPVSCLENSMDGGAWQAIYSMGSQRVRPDWATKPPPPPTSTARDGSVS